MTTIAVTVAATAELSVAARATGYIHRDHQANKCTPETDLIVIGAIVAATNRSNRPTRGRRLSGPAGWLLAQGNDLPARRQSPNHVTINRDNGRVISLVHTNKTRGYE